jgi:hypothetical protein
MNYTWNGMKWCQISYKKVTVHGKPCFLRPERAMPLAAFFCATILLSRIFLLRNPQVEKIGIDLILPLC